MTERGRWLWAAAGVLLAGALLRLLALGREGLWCDEAYTALLIRQPPGELIASLLGQDDAPPLFYLLQKLITSLLGDGEGALRLLPALSGIAGIGVLLASGERAARTWSAAIFATSAFAVFYARQARSYALVMLLVLIVIQCARGLLSGRRGGGLGLAVAGTLLCLTHHLGGLMVATSLVLWPLFGRRTVGAGRWLAWHAVPLLTWGALLFLAGDQLATHARLNTWMGEFWRSTPLAVAPLLSLGAFSPEVLPANLRAVPMPSAGPTSALWGVLSALAAAAALVAALIRRREAAIEAAFLFLPLAALVAISLVTTPIYVLGRTDAIAYPAFALLLGRGLARLPRSFASGALVLWTALSVAALAPGYGIGSPRGTKGADRDLATDMVAAGLAPHDWLVHGFLTAPSLEYYLDRHRAPHVAAWFPPEAAENPAGVLPTSIASLPIHLDQALSLREEMEQAMPEDASAWILALDARSSSTLAPLTAEQIGYPTNLLVYALSGEAPITPLRTYRQDWVGGRRLLLRLPRAEWVPVDSLPPIRTAEGG